ncbi:hypothetical protein OPQ81_002606 [Rhizoctonia solani]|nr:hypothetical protein OPQ81_002606 [Rhizoctonia solani]
MPFVQFANHALKLLAPLSPEGLQATLGLGVLFQVNDPQQFKGFKGSFSLPDVVLISLPSARQVHKDPRSDWNQLVNGHSTLPPKGLEWPNILAPLELKWNYHPICSEIPTKYSTGLNSPIKPITIPHDPAALVTVNSNSTTTTSTQASASSDSNLSIPQQPKRASGHLDQDVSEPASKRPKLELHNHDIKQTREDALVQSGINGVEMLSCSLSQCHALGMVIIDATIWVWWYD